MGAVTAAVIGGAAAVGSAAMASDAAAKGRKQAEKFAKQGAAAFQGVDLPSIEDQKINLIASELQGEYRPEAEQALDLGPSSMEDISVDQALADAQRQSLEGISEIAEGGLTEGDIAAAREMKRSVDQSNQARQKAILNEMAQRGVLGSGMELAARLKAQQDSAEQASAAGDRLTQQAQARALAALGQQGTLAGQIRGQEFGEQSDIARARDAINQFNTVNRQNVIQRNIAEQNRAQQANLAARQAQADQAAALRNQQHMHNVALQQQKFQNEIAKASGLAGQYQGLANQATAAGSARANEIGAIGGAIGNIAGAFGNMSSKPTPQPANTGLSAMNTTLPAKQYGGFDPSSIA